MFINKNIFLFILEPWPKSGSMERWPTCCREWLMCLNTSKNTWAYLRSGSFQRGNTAISLPLHTHAHTPLPHTHTHQCTYTYTLGYLVISITLELISSSQRVTSLPLSAENVPHLFFWTVEKWFLCLGRGSVYYILFMQIYAYRNIVLHM